MMMFIYNQFLLRQTQSLRQAQTDRARGHIEPVEICFLTSKCILSKLIANKI